MLPPNHQADLPYVIGLTLGVLIFHLLPLVGLVGTLGAMRHRDASRKALAGLALVVVVYLSFATYSLVLMWSGENAAQMMASPVARVLAALGFVLLLILTLSGGMLAALGVADTHRYRERFRRGRRRGYLALVLAGGLLLLMLVGFVMGITRRGSAGPPGPTFPNVSKPIANQEWNYRITPPPGWVTMDSKALNPLATFSATRANPQVFAMVLCEHLGAGTVSLEAVAEAIKGRMSATGTATATQRKEQVDGYDGLLIETEMRSGVNSFFFTHWLTHQAGTFYQVVTWGDIRRRETVLGEALRYRRSFSILDPGKTFLPASEQAGRQYHSKAHGWSVDLTGTEWKQRWTTLATDVPSAEWGVLNLNGNAFCVIPVWVGKDEAPLEAVSHGLAAQIGIVFPDSAIYGVKELAVPGPRPLTGQSFKWEGERDGRDYHFRMRVLQDGDCSYLLAAWAAKTRELRTDSLDEALDLIHFDADWPRRPPLDQLSTAEQKAHRLILNSIGVSEQRDEHLTEAQSWFKKAYELGRNEATVLLNYVGATNTLGKPQEALDYLLGELKRFPNNKKLVTAAADLQMLSGDVPAGLQRYAELFDSGFRDDALFTNYVHAACEHKQADEAAKLLERYAAGHDSPRLRKLSALIAQARGDFPGALAILEKLRAEGPNDVDTLSALADCQFAAKQYTECIASCDRMLELNRDAAGVYYRKGLAEFSLKRYREAKASVELAHQKQPADVEVKRMLDYLTGMVGQGANLAVKTPIDAVPLPADLPTAPEAKANDEYLRGFSAYYRQSIQSISYEPGQELRTTERRLLKVVDQQGVQSLSTLEFPYDPLAEEIYVNNVTVRDADGKITAVAKVEDSYLVDAGGGGQVATQQKILHVPVPSLQPGSTIESTITRRDTGRVKAFPFHGHSFSKSLPVLRSTVVLTAPESAVKWEASQTIAPAKWKGGLRWTVERPAIFRLEPQMVTPDKILPMLWLADAGASWPAVAREYMDSIKDHLAIDPAVKAAAAEAVKGKTSEQEKIAALARLTQEKLTYKAVEFGRRARIPNHAAQTLANRYGDCKDHALLLTQLLESVGIPAKLALINFGTPLRKGLPSLDQFDHMIVYTPQGKGGRFIDCTGKTTDLASSGAPLGLATQTALILDPEHPKLETLPDYAPGCSGLKVERDISMPGSGADLLVRETVTFSGVMASSMRSALISVQPSERKRVLLRMLDNELPGVDLQEAEVEQIDDPHVPLKLRLRYLLRQRCQVAGARLIGRLPAPWERMNLAPTPVEKRTTAFRLWVPTTFETTVRITPPAEWKPVVPEKRQLDKPFCTGGLEARMDARVLRLDGHLTQRTGEFPAAQYGAYIDAMGEGIRLTEQNLVFEKK
jgi:tetratricopeptide (TPR) repeat protein